MRTIAFSFVCLLAMGCHHEAQPAPVEGLLESRGTVRVNGTPATIYSYVSPVASSSWVDRDSFLSMGFWVIGYNPANREKSALKVGFEFFPVAIGSYIIPPGYQQNDTFFNQRATYAVQYFKGYLEEPCDRYFGADHADSWVKVLSYDAAAHQACLQFELHLAAEVYDCQDFPDTLHFTEGEICLDVMPR